MNILESFKDGVMARSPEKFRELFEPRVPSRRHLWPVHQFESEAAYFLGRVADVKRHPGTETAKLFLAIMDKSASSDLELLVLIYRIRDYWGQTVWGHYYKNICI